jgi:hypothetical protein
MTPSRHHRNDDTRLVVGVKRWMAALDAACARVNPILVVVAVVIALLDFGVAAERWTVAQPEAPVSIRTVIVTVPAEGSSPALAPELRDMAGHD